MKPPVTVTAVGSGDAFGSGGRLQTCYHVAAGEGAFLIDCGATVLVGLKRLGLEPNAIHTVFITHFHLDHFFGLPLFILDAQFGSRRRTPLTIVGPTGIEARLEQVMELAYPGSAGAQRKFETEIVELAAGGTAAVNDVAARAIGVSHGNPGGPNFGYRLTAGGRTVAYTGDTEWTEALVELGRGADLLIAEAYMPSKRAPLHLDLETLSGNLGRIGAKRVLATHMADEVLAMDLPAGLERSRDGLAIALD
ncbi:MAG: MBL fold metallo-hydrolase [Rhizobiales bacterium NRL2]|jgi:ribonuclease BN (tRNA processing enzyme)|nr:MAG: MBL fold metallo-hydrolase [Rhizobiales bacterium NRL2]